MPPIDTAKDTAVIARIAALEAKLTDLELKVQNLITLGQMQEQRFRAQKRLADWEAHCASAAEKGWMW